MNTERRRAPRYQFIADAEVAEVKSGTKAKAKTGDLSIGGCFLNTLNPSREGTEIHVTIFRESMAFAALGRVVFVFPRLGMGVLFTSIEADQLVALQEWLSELKLGRGLCKSFAIESSINRGGRES
jgi:hypothetical protein